MRYISLLTLLDTLDQPTKYQWGLERVRAIEQLRSCMVDFVQQRLDGHEMPVTGRHIEILRMKYKITDEEIYGVE